MTPEVPRKIEAGWKLKRRKPRSAPASTTQSNATYGWPTWTLRLSTPSVRAAIRAIPVERPSSPSMKFMLLIIPTIQMTVNAIANGVQKAIASGPNGLLITLTPSPNATATAGQDELTEQLPPGAEVEQVVHHPDQRREHAAAEDRGEVAGTETRGRRHAGDAFSEQGQATGDHEERDDHRQAAAAGHGAGVHPPVVRGVDDAPSAEKRADRRGQEQRQDGGRRERNDEDRDGGAGPGDERHATSSGSPGTGKRSTMAATFAASSAPAAIVVACARWYR